MPTLDDVYRKFGEAAEAAQLLQTELGTILLTIRGAEGGLFDGSDPARAADLLAAINRHTLGQLIKASRTKPLPSICWNNCFGMHSELVIRCCIHSIENIISEGILMKED